MNTTIAARALGLESALQRHSREREPVLAKARDMRAAFKLAPAAALAPTLILTSTDRI